MLKVLKDRDLPHSISSVEIHPPLNAPLIVSIRSQLRLPPQGKGVKPTPKGGGVTSLEGVNSISRRLRTQKT